MPLSKTADLPFVSNKDRSSGSNPGFALYSAAALSDVEFNMNTVGGTRMDLAVALTFPVPPPAQAGWTHLALSVQRGGFVSVFVNGQRSLRQDISASAGRSMDAGLKLNIGQVVSVFAFVLVYVCQYQYKISIQIKI